MPARRATSRFSACRVPVIHLVELSLHLRRAHHDVDAFPRAPNCLVPNFSVRAVFDFTASLLVLIMRSIRIAVDFYAVPVTVADPLNTTTQLGHFRAIV